MDPQRAVPTHPRISDAAARALVQAIMDAELLGIALIRGTDHTHAMANAKYQALVGDEESVVGRVLDDLMPMNRAPAALIARVLDGSGPVVQREVLFSGFAAGTLRSRWVTLTYQRVDEPEPSVLVLADDVTDRVRERGRAELFVKLVGELSATLDDRAVVRSIVTQTQHALGATASSIFRVSADGKMLHGAVGSWDWTRTSFEVPLEEWPTVQRAVDGQRALFITATDARRAELGWFETRGITAALCVPLRTADRVTGVFFFDFDVLRAPEPSAVQFAENVATHCAAALERAGHHPR
jgi:hypothetical protein